MRANRLTLAVSALLAVTALAGCSGDEEPTSEEPGSSASAGADEGGEDAEAKVFERRCDVTVDMTGAVDASWTGKGRSSNEAGSTIYTFEQGEERIFAYAGDDELPTSANVTAGGATYTTFDPESGLEVAENGRSAEVDAMTRGVDGKGPRLVASFTCGKGGKGGKG